MSPSETNLPPLILLPIIHPFAASEECLHESVKYVYAHNPDLVRRIGKCEELSVDPNNDAVFKQVMDELHTYLADVVSKHVSFPDVFAIASAIFEVRRHVRHMYDVTI